MKTKNTILNKLFVIFGLCLTLLIFILLTNPDSIALPLLVVPFGLIGLIVYKLSDLILMIIGKTEKRVKKILSISVSSFVVVILLLQSLNQLTWKDCLITFVFAVFFWLYVWRADFLHK